MAEDVRHDDTPQLYECVQLRPRRKVDPMSGYAMMAVWGLPMGCRNPKSYVLISKEADIIRLQNQGIPFKVAASSNTPENITAWQDDTISVEDFRIDVQQGFVTLFFRYHYMLVRGIGSVYLERSLVKKEG